ncbi:hypothetical protein D3C80_1773420 [compost metagenome]
MPWARGTSAAPATPWSRRNTTISPMDWAIPQSTEVKTKPEIDQSSTRLRPNRLARNAEGGVMTAAATI